MSPPARLVLLALTAAAVFVWAAPASAGVVEFETPAHVPSEVVFTDETGEPNSLSITQTGDEVVIHDSTAPISTRSGCTQRTPNEAVCPVALSVRVVLGAGNDVTLFNGVTGYATVFGGPGDDVLRGTATFDNLHGGGGQDQLYGRGGNDRLADEDVESGEAGAGPDTIEGGGGRDTVDYRDRGRSQRVVIDLARQRGAGDTIRGIEVVRTGPADDTIAGDGRNNTFDGGGGRDTLLGRGGSDDLTIQGGGLVEGGRGDDWIWVEDDGATNRISCGLGHDHVASYATDVLSASCEHANAGRVTVGLEGLRGTKRPVRRRGVLRFRVACTEGDSCTGRLWLLRADGNVASSARYAVFGDRSYISFRLPRSDRRRILRGARYTFTTARDGAPGFSMFVRATGGRP